MLAFDRADFFKVSDVSMIFDQFHRGHSVLEDYV